MSGNVGFVSEAENFKLGISLFVNKTYSCCKMSTTEAAQKGLGANTSKALSWAGGMRLCFAFSIFVGGKGWQ